MTPIERGRRNAASIHIVEKLDASSFRSPAVDSKGVSLRQFLHYLASAKCPHGVKGGGGLEEPHRAVHEQEIAAAGVLRLESSGTATGVVHA